MPWTKLLAWASGQIDEALRQKLEFALEENRVYRSLLNRYSSHWRLQDSERKTLAEKGKPVLSENSVSTEAAGVSVGGSALWLTGSDGRDLSG